MPAATTRISRFFVRVYSRVEAYDFLDAGEEIVYRDALDSSLRLGGDVLRMLGESDESAARIYRERNELMVREMARHRHDSNEYLSAAKEAHRSLDELMRKGLRARGNLEFHSSKPRTRSQ